MPYGFLKIDLRLAKDQFPRHFEHARPVFEIIFGLKGIRHMSYALNFGFENLKTHMAYGFLAKTYKKQKMSRHMIKSSTVT